MEFDNLKFRDNVTKERYRKAVDLYNEIQNINKVSKEIGVCEKKLNSVLKELGLKINKPGPKSKYKVNENFFKIIDNESKAYWLGFITADGCIKSSGTFQLKLGYVDIDHLRKFKDDIKSTHPISLSDKSKNTYAININNKIFVNNLKDQGIEPLKSTYETFNENLPKELYKHYLRGLFDGDGWFSLTGKTIEIGLCSSKDMCTKVSKFLSKELSIKERTVTENNKNKNNGLYRIRYASKNDIIKIITYFYKDAKTILDRKNKYCVEFLNEQN